MKVLAVGESTYDVCAYLDNAPLENLISVSNEKKENGDGIGSNIACLLAKWGEEVYLSTAVGGDVYGEKIRKEYDMFSIKKDFVESIYDKETPWTFSVFDKTKSTKTSVKISNPDKTPMSKRNDFNMDPDVVVMDGYDYFACNTAIDKYSGVKTLMIVKENKPQTVELAKYCKLVIISKKAAEELSGVNVDSKEPAVYLKLYNTLKQHFSRNEIFIYLGVDGVIYQKENQVQIMPSINVEYQDETKLIDYFSGAYAYCLGNSFDLMKSLSYSLITSGLATSATNRSQIPDLNNVLSYYNEKLGASSVVSEQPKN